MMRTPYIYDIERILQQIWFRNDGRWRAGARLTLTKPELLDDWPKSRENVFVRNKEVNTTNTKQTKDNTKHKTTLAQSRENVFVRNKEVNTNTKQTKQHSPKSRRVINKEVNMTTKTNKHNNLRRCIIQTPNKKK